MESINFENDFKESIAEEIIIKDGYAYRRDMLRVARVYLGEGVEEKTFEYKVKRDILKYQEGNILSGNDKKMMKPLPEKDKGRFEFWKLFEKEPVFSVMLEAKEIIELFIVQDRMLRATNQNQYKATVVFDLVNEDIIMYGQEGKEERKKTLKIVQKKGIIEEQKIEMHFALAFQYIKGIIEGTNRLRIDLYEKEGEKRLIKIGNKKKQEIIFAQKQ